jgi:6-phosphogluconolactonase (cycloisomerase 2 family)
MVYYICSFTRRYVVKRLLVGISCLLILFCAAGAWSKDARKGGNDFFYATINYNFIRQFKIASNGTLLPLSPPAVSPGKGFIVNQIILHPNKRFLYVVCSTDMNRWVSEDISTGRTSLHPYRIADDGRLIALTPVIVYTGPVLNMTGGYAAMDPKGRFLYVLVEGGTVFVYRIRPDGALSKPLKSQVACSYNPVPKDNGGPIVGGQGGLIEIDPKGRFLYTTDYYGFQDIASNEEAVYRINQKTGALKLLAGPFDSSHGPWFDSHSHFDSSDGFAYANREKDGVRIQYRLTNKGALVPTGVKQAPRPAFLQTFSRDHKCAYAGSGNRITVYRIDHNGRFEAVSNYKTDSVYEMTLAPGGQYLYTASNPYHGMHESSDCHIAQFHILPHGTLTPLDPPFIRVEDRCTQMIPVRIPSR